MDKAKKQFAIQTIRRGSYRWPTRWKAEKRSRLSRGVYYCESCGLIIQKKDSQMDHVLPVVDPNVGFNGFDSYIDRMYPDDENGWARLCKPCHKEKTAIENSTRLETKHAKKRPKKKKTS